MIRRLRAPHLTVAKTKSSTSSTLVSSSQTTNASRVESTCLDYLPTSTACPGSVLPLVTMSEQDPFTKDDFRDTIEEAWNSAPDSQNARTILADPTATLHQRQVAGEKVWHGAPRDMIHSIPFTTYPKAMLAAWHAHCEKLMSDLDTEELHQALGGRSDEDFQYARGFIVIAGRQYYDLVRGDPRTAVTVDGGGEDLCLVASLIYEDM